MKVRINKDGKVEIEIQVNGRRDPEAIKDARRLTGDLDRIIDIAGMNKERALEGLS